MDTGSPAGTGNEYVARARGLAPQIEACADQIEQERRLAPPVLDALFAAGVGGQVLKSHIEIANPPVAPAPGMLDFKT
jgi:hypothetical protein